MIPTSQQKPTGNGLPKATMFYQFMVKQDSNQESQLGPKAILSPPLKPYKKLAYCIWQ